MTRSARHRGIAAVGAGQPPAGPQRVVYQPPALLARYQRAKLVGGLLFTAIFAGWLWLQWSNPWIRSLAVALVGLTAWITGASVLADRRRHAGRQIELAGDALLVTTPEGTRWIALGQIDHAVWTDDGGMTFHGRDGRALAALDTALLADEEEARRFLGWLRRHAPTPWPVHWARRA